MTSGLSARGFIRGQAPFLRERGWQTHLICSSEGDVDSFARQEGLTFTPLAMERNPSPWRDLQTVAALYSTLRSLRPDVAVWGSPKASLLGCLVCRLLRIPTVYLIHGLRLEGACGIRKGVLALLEALTCRLATTVVADGFELRDLAVRLHLVPRRRVTVLAQGSANGVAHAAAAPRYRGELGIAPSDVVVTFAGRITGDKGVRELALAWPEVARERPEARLLVAGRPDPSDPTSDDLRDLLAGLPRTHLLGHVDDLDRLWADSDVVVLPSYREGLPLVVIEAAAAGVPAVVSDCTGGREVVQDGTTGLVVPVRDVAALSSALSRLVGDAQTRTWMGDSARTRALSRYDRPRLWAALERCLRTTASTRRVTRAG